LLEHRGNEALVALQSIAKFYDMLNAAVRSLNLNVERARAEIDGDYSTTTELADILQRDAGVPFRTGHHFASELVNFGRSHCLKPSQIPYAEAERIYSELATSVPHSDTRFPLSDARFREALSADNMIRSSCGLGGPQPDEVTRMLGVQNTRLKDDRAWLILRREQLAHSGHLLDKAFIHLRK
jgi:argininosuccinate lyase